jgi:hypothetical protein
VRKRLMSLCRSTPDAGVIAFVAVLTASVVLNIRFTVDAAPKTAVFAENGLLEGTHLPDIIVGERGEALRPFVVSRTTLLYIFSPGCEWSKGDYPNLRTIAKVAGARYDLVEMYTNVDNTENDVQAYLRTHPFPGHVTSVDLRQTNLADDLVRRLRSTPQLLVVERGGFIRRAWSGAFFGDRQRDAEKFFGVTLPGVTMKAGIAVLTSNPQNGLD